MAQKRKQRRRKHRGTKTGRIERKGRTSRPMSRGEARQQYRAQRSDRAMQAPSWRGAINRAIVAALIFFVVVAVVFGQPIASAISISAFMLLVYIPLGYYTDRFMWRRRMAKLEREKRRRREERKSG